MTRSLVVHTFLILVSYTLVSSALVQTENLGQLDLHPGFAARLYTTSLTSPEDFDSRPDYLKNREFLTDGQLISQNVITSFEGQWVRCYQNDMFGLFRDQRNVILEMRGYLKAPDDGVFSVSVGMDSIFDEYGNFKSQFNRGYWIIKNSVSLNQTADGFICSYNSSGVKYTGIVTDYECLTYCIPPLPEAGSVLVSKDQYYPVVSYSYLGGDSLSALWTFNIDGGGSYNLEDYFFYDLNDDFAADDKNLNAEFPDACPQFHEQIFSSEVFSKPSTIYTNGCPVTSTSSWVPPVSSVPSSSATPTLTESNSSLSSDSSSSITLSSTESSSSTSLISQISSLSDTLSTYSSLVSSSSLDISLPSSDSYSIHSRTESQTASVNSSIQSIETGSNVVTETSSSSEILSGSNLELSSFIVDAGKPIYTSNGTTPNSQGHTQISRPTLMKSSSTVKVKTSKNNDDFSTTVITESETDTYTTTTCPEIEHKSSRDTSHSSLLVSNVHSELTSSEAVLLSTQNRATNGVIKTTVGRSEPTITYSECASCNYLQEIGARISETENKSTESSFRSTYETEHTQSSDFMAGVLASGAVISSGQSTSVALQAFPDEGHFSTYQPLLLVIAILMTFL